MVKIQNHYSKHMNYIKRVSGGFMLALGGFITRAMPYEQSI